MGYIIGAPVLILGIWRVIAKKNVDYLTITLLEWGMIITLSSMKLYGMYPFSQGAYLLIGMGVFFFSCMCWMEKNSTRKKVIFTLRKTSRSKSCQYSINYHILYLCEIILTIFVLYVAWKTLVLLRSGVKMGTIHAMYLNRGEDAFFTSTIIRELHAKFAVPMLYCNCAITAYLILFQRKKYSILIWVNVFDLILWVIATGGRFILVYFLVDLILAFPLCGITISPKAIKKIKKTIKKIVIILIGIVVGYTIFRKGFLAEKDTGTAFSQVFEEFYKYFSLAIPLFQYWVKKVIEGGKNTWGSMTFYGLFSNFNWILVKTRLGSLGFLTQATNILGDVEKMVPIFSDASCNAFVTCFFYFFSDFGVAGVVLGSSLFGWLCGSIDKAVHHSINTKSILIYLLLSQSIVKMFVRFELANASYVIAFLYIMLIIKKEKVSIPSQ